ncbi:hypothetical protein IMZ48_20155 [Candidatus Bathyarchaeota archaeon]|nr:hypothetical protein [Candidatus Bathyarchaeota archaeon]
MSSSIDIWRGPTPPPQLGPYHTSSREFPLPIGSRAILPLTRSIVKSS